MKNRCLYKTIEILRGSFSKAEVWTGPQIDTSVAMSLQSIFNLLLIVVMYSKENFVLHV